MQQRWFKMPVGATQNPVMRVIARKYEYDLATVVMTYMVACELYQEENRKFQNDDELFDLIHILTGDGVHVVEAIIQSLRERHVLNENDFENQPSANAERQRRFKEKNRAVTAGVTGNVTGNGEGNVTGNAVEREKEREKERTPHTPQGGGEGENLFEEFWKARPGRGNAIDVKREAEREFAKLIEGGADGKELLQAMQGYAAAQRAAKKDGTQHSRTAASFLRDGCFEQYIRQEGAAAVDAGLDLPDWQQTLCQLLPPVQVRTWFKGADFDGKVIRVPKKFASDWIKKHFVQAIEKTLGNVQINVGAA